MSGYAGSKGVPAAKAGVVFSGLLVLVGGALVILGSHIRIAMGCLALFLIPVTYLMHDFWNEKDMMGKINQQVNFQKNVALLGAALFLLMISRPWPFSLNF